MKSKAEHIPWYKESFGEDYLLIYKHRDDKGATEEVHQMLQWLDLPEDAAILDLCCGMGRHSIVLAEAGYQVTGMDLSEELLQEARLHDASGQVCFVQGDMRSIPLAGPFDAVVNLFTSFGYFEHDVENEKVLHEVARVLAPNGKFIVDYLNPEHVIRHLIPYSKRHDQGTSIQEYRSIEQHVVCKTIVLSDGCTKPRKHEERVQLYGLEHFQAMFDQAGLILAQVYGDYRGSPYEEKHSERMIMVGHK